ncbi:MAG: 4Fe-4S dicluster domain-containing protein, partial [Dehalococcoidia bacterium]
MSAVDYKETVHRCFRCGFCKLTYDYSPVGYNCPMYHRFRLETYSPGGLNWLIRAAMINHDIEWSEHLGEILYSCAMCGNCAESCRFEFAENLLDNFMAVREEVIEKQLSIPPMVKKFLENVYLYANSYRSDTSSATCCVSIAPKSQSSSSSSRKKKASSASPTAPARCSRRPTSRTARCSNQPQRSTGS